MSQLDRADHLLKTARTADPARFADANPNIVIQVDLAGKITFCNAAAVCLLREVGLDETQTDQLLPPDIDKKIVYLLLHHSNRCQVEHGVGNRTILYSMRAFPDEDNIFLCGTDITEQVQNTQRIAEEKERFQLLLEASAEGILVLQGLVIRFANRSMAAMLDVEDAHQLFDQDIRALVAPPQRQSFQGAAEECLKGNSPQRIEFRVLREDSRLLWLECSLSMTAWDGQPAIVATCHDVSDRKLNEALQADQNRVLELLATAAPLEEVLSTLVRAIERQFPGLLCSVLIMDDEGGHLHCGAAPSLPKAYNQAIEGLTIGPQAGSCGTAAFRRERVIVEDTQSDPLWADFRDLAREHCLGACWSEPILSANQEVLGTFAMYYAEPRRPSEVELSLIAKAANLAGLAIERKRAEDRLRLTQFSVDHGADAAFWIGRDGHFMYVNDAACKTLGYTREEMLLLEVSDVDPEHSGSNWENHWRELERKRSVTFESKHRRKDGSVFPVEITANFLDFGGKAINCAFARDITERKQAESDLQKQREEQQIIFDSSPAMIWYRDKEARILRANKLAAQSVGLTVEELEGRSVYDLFPDEAARYHEDDLEVIKSGKPKLGIVEKYRVASGEKRWTRTDKIPYRDKEGNVIGVIVFAVDITDQHSAQDEIKTRARQQTVVAELGQCALADMDLSELMDQIVFRVAQNLEVEYCKILELLPGGEEMVVRAGTGWREGTVGIAKVGTETTSQAGYTLKSSGPVIVEDLRGETRFSGPELLLSHHVISGMSVIILGPDKPFGVLGAHSSERHAFTDDDTQFLQAVANVLATAIERDAADAALRERVEFEKLITSISTNFIDLTPRQTDAGINNALRRIAEFTGVQRSYIFLYSEDELRMTNSHEWCAEGIESQKQRVQDVSVDVFPWWNRIITQLEPVQVLDVATLPREARIEKAEFQAQGIRSLVCVPMVYGGKLVGFLGLDSVSARKSWSEETIALLKIVGEIFVNALQRKSDEEKLHQLRRHNELILDSAAEGIYGLDLDGRMTFVNPAAARMIGHAPQELIGKKQHDILHHTRKDGTPYLVRECPIYAAFSDGVVHHADDEVFWRKDGTCFPVEYTSTPIMEEGEIVGAVVTFSDISARKDSEEALRESENRYRTLFEAASDAIFLYDAEGRILDVNEKACQMYGYAREELLQLKAGGPLSAKTDDSAKRIESILNHSAAGETQFFEWRGRRKDGSTFPEEVALKPLTISGRELLLGIIRDVTERKKAEKDKSRLQAKLFQSQKAESIALLAGGIAHDFNNLLAGILGFASLASEQVGLAHPAAEPLNLICQSAENAARLTRELLAYARGGPQIRELIDLNPLVGDILALLGTNIPKSVEVERRLSEERLIVEADPAQVQQVIMNLCINAGEAIGDETGRITISTGRRLIARDDPVLKTEPSMKPGKYVWLEVCDTGCGLSEEVLGKIFDPFFSTKKFGRGMGLAAVQGIVTNHRGCIQIENAPSGGSTFRVFLPAAEKEIADQTSGQHAATGGSETVLIADDEEIVLQVTEACLLKLGYSVMTAANSKEALAMFKKRSKDIKLVILDVMMPVMEGEELLTALRGVRPDVKILLTSGYIESVAQERLQNARVCGFLQKPYSSRTLGDFVRKALDEP